MKQGRVSWFNLVTLLVLFALCGAIAALVISNVTYLTTGAIGDVLGSSAIQSACLLTLATSVLTTALAIIVAVPSAYALSRNGNILIVRIADVVIDLLMVVPVLVIGVSVLVFFRAGSLLASHPLYLLQLLGALISKIGDLFIYQKAGIVLTQFICSVPFAVRVIKATIDEIPPRTTEVAQTLGCTPAGAFFRITLPMALRGVVSGALLAWARAFGLFGPVTIVAGAVRNKTEVLSTSIFLEISIGRLEHAITISLLMILIAAIALGTIRVVTGGDLFSSGRMR